MTRAWTGPLLALLLLPAATPAEEIRRWVDAAGRVHFGDGAAAPGASESVRTSRGNFVAGARSTEAAAGSDDGAPRSWSHAARSEPVLPVASRPDVPAAVAPAAPAPAQLADAGGPACMPVEYKKISPRTGQIVRMRRLPCQPGVAPVEIGPY